MKPNRPQTSSTSKQGGSTRTWVVRSLLVVFTTAFGCSLLTSLDFVGNAKPDAGAGLPDGSAPSSSVPDGSAPDGSDCDEICTAGKICVGGHCTCPEGTSECNGTCLESLEDAGYCGTCGNTCRGDQHCSDNGCVCGPGLTDCTTECADLRSDPEHCGDCKTSCLTGQFCIQGACKSSPCDDLCTNPQVLPMAGDGFRRENLGTDAFCFSVVGYQPTLTNSRIVCWNFENGRALSVNGKPVPCVGDQGHALVQEEMGWYCIQGSTGGSPYAGFLLPTK